MSSKKDFAMELKKIARSKAGWVSTMEQKEEELKARMLSHGIKLTTKQCESLIKYDKGVRKWNRDIASGEVYTYRGGFYRKNHIKHTCTPTASILDGVRVAIDDLSRKINAPIQISNETENGNGIIVFSNKNNSWVSVLEAK